MQADDEAGPADKKKRRREAAPPREVPQCMAQLFSAMPVAVVEPPPPGGGGLAVQAGVKHVARYGRI